jgi:hypothetical protein
MSTTVFDSGDKPYMEWLSTNPLGFVLNTEKTVGTKYMFFHRAACRHISEAKAAQPDAYTGNKYIKVTPAEKSRHP